MSKTSKLLQVNLLVLLWIILVAGTRPPRSNLGCGVIKGTESVIEYQTNNTISNGEVFYPGEAPIKSSNQTNTKISNGEVFSPGEAPFMVRLTFNPDSNRESFCSGIIVNERWILTAAQCVFWFTLKERDLYVVIGDHTQLKEEGGEKILKIDRIKIRDETRATPDNKVIADIALLKTKLPMKFEITTSGYGSVNRICTPPSINDYEEDLTYTIAGWGHVDEFRQSDILRKIPVKIENGDTERCLKATSTIDKKRVICAASKLGGPCHLDAGGPLMLFKNGKYFLHGIITYHKNYYTQNQLCMDYLTYPGIYTKVDKFINWIIIETEHYP